MSARILLAGGGTAGHLFPALAVGEQLRELAEQVDILLVGTRSDRDNPLLTQSGLPSAFICARPFPYGLSWQLLPSGLALLWSTAQALAVVRRFRPTVIFGTGGYVSAPVVSAGGLLGIPRVVHIGDAYPDRTGRLVSRGAKLVTLAFATAGQHLGGRTIRHTGTPVRQQILIASRSQGQELLGLDADRFIVLVTGGSQGARSLNQALLAALPQLLADADLQIVHLVGRRDYDTVKTEADRLGASPEQYNCYAFLEQMGPAMAAADLIVSRAGSSSIGEATALGKPLILIPYPHAAGHQKYNAAEVEKAGAAVVIEDSDLSGATLAAVILALREDDERRAAMAEASTAWGGPEAARDIAQLLLAM